MKNGVEGIVKNIVENELEIPEFIGALPFYDVSCYQDSCYQFVWHMLWTDGEDEIAIDLRLNKMDLDMDFMKVRERLNGQFQEKVALLRMRYPGDFEVECVDALGVEDRLDEGLTYLAEESNQNGMIWVYDRFLEKRIYMESRFKKVEKIKVLKDGDDDWKELRDKWGKRGGYDCSGTYVGYDICNIQR